MTSLEPRDVSTGLKEEPGDQQDQSDQDFLLDIKKEETLDSPDPPMDISNGLKEEPTDDQDTYPPSDPLMIKKEEAQDTLDPPKDTSTGLREEPTDHQNTVHQNTVPQNFMLYIFPGLPSSNKQTDEPRRCNTDQYGKTITTKKDKKLHQRVHTGEKLKEDCHCTVNINDLRGFRKLDFKGKTELLSKGRPKPALTDLHTLKGRIARGFQEAWYDRKKWLCGCAASSRLFCYSCTLFSTSDYSVWTHAGFGDLNNLTNALSKHERTAVHIKSQVALKTFGTSRIDVALDEQTRLSNKLHNRKVRENRDILNKLIDATCYLAKQEIAFQGNEEGKDSLNCDNLAELINLIAKYDMNLATHLSSSTVFFGLSNKIQNDLIEAIGDVIINNIKNEISEAPFVAVEVDESTDVTDKAQASVILRYVLNQEVKEAFLGFDDVSSDRTAEAIAEYVLSTLEKLNCLEKLVAQTYDGASVMASSLNGVQAKIRQKIPEAIFMHCYAHELNLLLSQSARSISECQVFFKTVEGLSSFFNKSTKRTKLLDEVVKRQIPRAAPTWWSSLSRLVQTISHHYSDLQAMFQSMIDNPMDWDNDTLMMATGYDAWLAKASTCFLIDTYEDIFNVTDVLSNVLQEKGMDIGYCCPRVQDTMTALENKRQGFDAHYAQFDQKCSQLNLTEGQAKPNQSIKDERETLFDRILNDTLAQMKARFSNFNSLNFIGLVDNKQFYHMSKEFDNNKFESLEVYAKHFDFIRLKADLVGLYRIQEVREKTPVEMLGWLIQHDLVETVPEATKLLKLVLTIPATTVSVERSFSAMKRVKTLSRNRTGQGRLSSLALISIEKERLSKLQQAGDFYSKVTEVFIRKERRMDFVFK